jgi:hypothetical protein
VGRYCVDALTVLSLLLCVATVGLWVRSFGVWDYLSYRRDDANELTFRLWIAKQENGYVRITGVRRVLDTIGGFQMVLHDIQTTRDPPLGFGRGSVPAGTRDDREEFHWHLGVGTQSGQRTTRALQVRPERRDHGYLHTAWFEVLIPYSHVALIFAVAPGIWAYRRWRRWSLLQRAPGLCARCGYDLRATPDRCPECGAAAKGKA